MSGTRGHQPTALLTSTKIASHFDIYFELHYIETMLHVYKCLWPSPFVVIIIAVFRIAKAFGFLFVPELII